jgi:hypothetical protein
VRQTQRTLELGPDARAQSMFQRVVTGWAMDALSLRRRGLDRPSSRSGRGLGIVPGRVDAEAWAIQPGPAPLIRWRPPSDLAA